MCICAYDIVVLLPYRRSLTAPYTLNLRLWFPIHCKTFMGFQWQGSFALEHPQICKRFRVRITVLGQNLTVLEHKLGLDINFNTTKGILLGD